MRFAAWTFMLCLCGSWASAAERGYYATKSDERTGVSTPGSPPAPLGVVPAAGGDTCAAPLDFPYCIPGPFMDNGTTVGADNTVSHINVGCSNYTTVAGPDVIYRFDYPGLFPSPPAFTAMIFPQAGYDVAVYLLRSGGGCPSGTNNAVANCIHGADAAGPGGTERIGPDGPNLALGTYYLFIDSFYSTGTAELPNRHQGTYSLQVGGLCPVELLEFSVE